MVSLPPTGYNMSQVRTRPHVPHVGTKGERALADMGPRNWARQTDSGTKGGFLRFSPHGSCYEVGSRSGLAKW